MPQMPQGVKPDGKQGGGFTPETPFSTRYFVLRYDDEGVLVNADLGSIAAVTTDDTTAYLQVATKHGVGYGWSNGYRYYVVKNGENRNMAIFLDAHRDLQTVKTTAWLSLAAMLFCVACVYLLSRRAIEPVVKASKKQKQFITDASHELKTPITVIATSLKVLEMETGENKWIDKSLAQTEKLRDLVNSLVSLSRMDEEQSPLKMCDFSLSDAVSETVGSFADFAAANGHMLTAEIAPEILYHGDEYAIRQMVSILLDNAVKYASDGSPIRLTAFTVWINRERPEGLESDFRWHAVLQRGTRGVLRRPTVRKTKLNLRFHWANAFEAKGSRVEKLCFFLKLNGENLFFLY